MVAALAERLGVRLEPRRLSLDGGGHLEIDAVAEDWSVLCEAWAHQGPPKSGQRQKVLTDALKLIFAGRLLGSSPRLILLFADEAAATPFRGRSWSAAALREMGIDIEVVTLPPEICATIIEAQRRQFR